MLTSCFLIPDKKQAKKDIELFYLENNLNSGAGNTHINSVEILSIQGNRIEAFVKGFHTNASLMVSKVDNIKDTLIFEYYDDSDKHKLKIILPQN